jgi:hypothetical protein
MSVQREKEKIYQVMMDCREVTAGEHRFGDIEYKLGKREIGHVHGNHLVDIPFPIKIRNEIIEKGEALPHHILPESGWVSIYLRNDENVNKAINLLNRSFEVALQQRMKRKQTNHLEKM